MLEFNTLYYLAFVLIMDYSTYNITKMKKLFLLLLIVPSLLFLGSCHKNSEVDPTDEGMSSLVVPADFDWKTTQTLDITVQLPSQGDLQPLLITNRDGSSVYFNLPKSKESVKCN